MIPRRPIRQRSVRGGANLYRRGADFERVLVRDLQRRGFVAWRTPGSRSPVDVIALAAARAVLVQAKRDGRITDEEQQAIQQLVRQLGAIGLIAVKVRTGFEYRDVWTGEPWNGLA